MAITPGTTSFRPLPTNQKPGDAIRARDAAETNRTLNALVQGVAPAVQVKSDPNGGSGSAIACTIVSIHRNHLVCTKKSGGTINVARPEPARSPDSETVLGIPWNYTSYSTDFQHRTATHASVGALTERHVVLREYIVGGKMRAIRVAGGTDVPEAPDYEDMSSDRTWYRDVATP